MDSEHPNSQSDLGDIAQGIVDRGADEFMLRRAAEACRNARKQMVDKADWFDWVPAHLDRLADLLNAAGDEP